MKIKCKLCGNSSQNEVMSVNELMLRSGDSFDYLHCSNCHCLQLINFSDDMAKYYPSDYYSYGKVIVEKKEIGFKAIIRKAAMRNHLGESNIVNQILGFGKKVYFPWILKGMITLDSKILDVGCGSGFLIQEMRHYGFKNLQAIDPFIGDDLICNEKGLKIFSSTLEALEDNNFDLIMLHHSFEHAENPLEVLQAAYKRVNENGIILIRTPIASSFAFRKYRQYWVQLDAPRHYFIHTVSSITKLCEQVGFSLEKVTYDSNSLQFSGSECYLRNIDLNETENLFSKVQMTVFQREAERLNAIHDGDSACFYLKVVK